MDVTALSTTTIANPTWNIIAYFFKSHIQPYTALTDFHSQHTTRHVTINLAVMHRYNNNCKFNIAVWIILMVNVLQGNNKHLYKPFDVWKKPDVWSNYTDAIQLITSGLWTITECSSPVLENKKFNKQHVVQPRTSFKQGGC